MAFVGDRVVIHLRDEASHDPIKAEFCAFQGLQDDREHFAVIFPPEESGDPLVRIHSECVTGDVFLSTRCDCGSQLKESIVRLRREGGILLYLRQEGRGVGLNNKLSAYRLQDIGHDTYSANRALGLPDDARSFQIAAQMLLALNVSKCRVLTNNPEKLRQLTMAGIAVTRVGMATHLSPHNESYLRAKRRHGHLLRI